MTAEFETGATSRVLRLPGNDGGWVPMHVTVNRVELDDGVFAGLITRAAADRRRTGRRRPEPARHYLSTGPARAEARARPPIGPPAVDDDRDHHVELRRRRSRRVRRPWRG